jgi:hypothetical protein
LASANSKKKAMTKPVISNVFLQDEYYWDQDFPIQFEVNDSVSGVASVHATINGKPVTNGSNYHFTEPGWHTYRIEVKDQAGWKAVYETKFEVYIPAKITFEPENLQLDHGSGMATNHIELPAPFEPEKINFATIQTNEKVVHVQDPKYGYVKNPIDDFDNNGIRDMMLKYERESLVNVIEPKGPVKQGQWNDGDITMFGEWDQYHFKGYDSIQVRNSGYTPPPPDVTPPAVSTVPQDGEENVSVDVTPIITFSEPVILSNGQELTDDTATGIVDLRNSSGQSIPFTANWMKNTLSLQINPTQQLEGLATYTLTVKPGTVTDSVNNNNELFLMSFKTENHQLNIEHPLPIPVIEEEEDSYTPIPAPTPQPPIPTPPPSNVTPTEQQVQLNEAVVGSIAAAGDEETVIDEVENTLSRIRNFTESLDPSVADKLHVIDHTVNTVMVAFIEKMKHGTVRESAVVKQSKAMLRDILKKVINNLAVEKKGDIDRAATSVANLSKKVIAELDDGIDLAEDAADVMNLLLSKENSTAVENDVLLPDVQAMIETVVTHINLFEESLGEYADKVKLDNVIHINIGSKTKGKLTVASETIDSLHSNSLGLGIHTESRAGMKLPPGLLKHIGDKDLQVNIEKVGEGKRSSTVNASDEYEFELIAGGEPFTDFGDEEVTVSIPLNKKMLNPQAYYYDVKKKKWLLVKSNNGKVAEVAKGKDVAFFPTPHFTKFRLTDVAISKLAVEPSRVQMEPGAELQLKVTAVVNKKNLDATSADTGTTYSSSQPDIVSVDENGLVKVSEHAKDGKRVTVTVKNGSKTKKVSITVFINKVTGITASPKKTSLEPGTSEQLKVIAKMSDRSTKDVTAVTTGTTYQSSNEDIATVDENGVVTIKEGAKKGDRVTITVIHAEKTAKCTITVK